MSARRTLFAFQRTTVRHPNYFVAVRPPTHPAAACGLACSDFLDLLGSRPAMFTAARKVRLHPAFQTPSIINHDPLPERHLLTGVERGQHSLQGGSLTRTNGT